MARLTRWLVSEAGLTLAEVVMALGLLSVGLTALLGTFPLAFSTIQSGRQSSTAVFLALQRLEEVKAFALSPDPAQGFTNLTSPNFPDEPYTAIAGHPHYRRQVAILDSAAVPANTKVVQVTVFYRPATGVGPVHETAVSVSTLIASR